jgi:hypothetical protein
MLALGMSMAAAIFDALAMSCFTPSRLEGPVYPYSPTPMIKAVRLDVAWAQAICADMRAAKSQKCFMKLGGPLDELDVANQHFAFGVSFQGYDHVFAFGCAVNLFGIELSEGLQAGDQRAEQTEGRKWASRDQFVGWRLDQNFSARSFDHGNPFLQAFRNLVGADFLVKRNLNRCFLGKKGS